MSDHILGMIDAPCAHPSTSPVQLAVTDETVAHVCLRCLRRLPAGWSDCDHEPVDMRRLGDPFTRYHCPRCGGWWEET